MCSINEKRLNKVLNFTDEQVLSKLLTKRIKPSTTRHIITNNKKPHNVKLIKALGLLDEPNYDKRVQLFLGYSKLKNWSFNTVKKYFNDLRECFGDSKLLPDRTAFINVKYVKLITRDTLQNILNYLQSNFNEFTAPVLVGFYTCLRTREILQWSTYTLFQLNNRHQYVDITLKQTIKDQIPENWRPIYTQQLIDFVSNLTLLYETPYKLFMENQINVKLFNISSSQLVNRAKTIYIRANNSLSPKGFGTHTFRYSLPTLLLEQGKDMKSAQMLLQHKHIKTTNNYVKSHADFIKNEFNRLTKDKFTATFYE